MYVVLETDRMLLRRFTEADAGPLGDFVYEVTRSDWTEQVTGEN